jgi:16S rRNA (adenine1518-N6/adenine1519-N6)-dimethyltransferase
VETFRKKKKYGQHFLTDQNISAKIANLIPEDELTNATLIEIGPGQGSLTKFLIKKKYHDFYLIEIDIELIKYLKETFPEISQNIVNNDFLKTDLDIFGDNIFIVGNFPYNISSQIVFKIIDNKMIVKNMVGMFQKEVAIRLNAKPGNKDYGILSVLTQAYYNVEYMFTIGNQVFSPPPKVDSAVVRLSRKSVEKPDFNEKLFKTIVKSAFNQRRKTLKNSLHTFKQFFTNIESDFLGRRPEELSIEDFIYLSKKFKN